LLAIVWLHESMHVYHLVGGSISLLGVLLAQTVQRPLFGRYRPAVSGTA
jgi:drug/metabolite transporter (DMT)-like permease